MTHSHSWSYVHAGVLVDVTDAQAAQIIRTAKDWGYQFHDLHSVQTVTSSGLTVFRTTQFSFRMEQNGRVEHFSLFHESSLSEL